MPDLQPVFDELRRRMSLHEAVFRPSVIRATPTVRQPARSTPRRLTRRTCFWVPPMRSTPTGWRSLGSRSASVTSAIT